MNDRAHLISLTGIRAIACVWVILIHFEEPLVALTPCTQSCSTALTPGYLGVDMFFALSGFVICYNYIDRLGHPTRDALRRYLVLRVARIYPVHLVTVLAVIGLYVAGSAVGITINDPSLYSPTNIIMNLGMLHQIRPAVPLNVPAWSIGVEFGAYLLFPLLAMLLVRTRSSRVVAPLLVGAFVVGCLVMHVIVNQPELPAYTWAWARAVIAFTLGSLLYVLWTQFGSRRRGAAWDAVAVLGLVVLTLSVQLHSGDTLMYIIPLTYLGLCLLVIGAAGSSGPVYRLLSWKPMVTGGLLSFSLYMTHFQLATVLGKVLDYDEVATYNPVVKAVMLCAIAAAVYALGWLMFHLVEEPGRKLVRRVLDPSTKKEGSPA